MPQIAGVAKGPQSRTKNRGGAVGCWRAVRPPAIVLAVPMTRQRPPRTASPEIYERIYKMFVAPVSAFDCGAKCAAHNDGVPVCCSTEAAIPIVDKHEWKLLKSRTDLWSEYKAPDKATEKELSDLHHDCVAIECKGFMHCERDNRSMSCRTFPFFPYIDRDGDFLGLSVFWTFEDRCWVQSHLQIVNLRFVDEFVAAYESLFEVDRDEFTANRDHSASMRRVFARFGRPIPLIGRDGLLYKVTPRDHKVMRARFAEFGRWGFYEKDAAAAPAKNWTQLDPASLTGLDAPGKAAAD